MLLFLALPIVALLAKGNPEIVLREAATPEVRGAVWLSLRTTALSLCLMVVLGLPVAILLGRGRFFGKGLIQGLVELPAVLPPAAAGIGLLLAFGRRGMVGQPLHLSIAFTTTAVVLAQIFVAVPLFIRAAASAISVFDREIEDQAATDGATGWQIATRVLLPPLAAPLAGGAVLAWARALGEFGATILFAGNLPGTTQTMPLALYLGFEQDLDRAVALGVLLLLIAASVLIVARLFTHRWDASS
jgi:molybdate transport system permease protein